MENSEVFYCFDLYNSDWCLPLKEIQKRTLFYFNTLVLKIQIIKHFLFHDFSYYNTLLLWQHYQCLMVEEHFYSVESILLQRQQIKKTDLTAIRDWNSKVQRYSTLSPDKMLKSLNFGNHLHQLFADSALIFKSMNRLIVTLQFVQLI